MPTTCTGFYFFQCPHQPRPQNKKHRLECLQLNDKMQAYKQTVKKTPSLENIKVPLYWVLLLENCNCIQFCHLMLFNCQHETLCVLLLSFSLSQKASTNIHKKVFFLVLHTIYYLIFNILLYAMLLVHPFPKSQASPRVSGVLFCILTLCFML